MKTPLDTEAIFVALVLAPATYSRNRFFDMYTDPAVRRARTRAAMLRSVVRHLAKRMPAERGEVTRIEAIDHAGAVAITYEVASLGLKRTTRMSAMELSTLRVALARADACPPELSVSDDDRSRVEQALARLAPVPLAQAENASS